MRRVHIIGRKNHGKSTLCCELISQLRDQGLQVGAIKHSSHRHELDVPGKDSHRLREAGAVPTAMWAGGHLAVHWPAVPESEWLGLIAPLYAGCDLVLVEGHKTVDDAPALEVWRAGLGDAPIGSAQGIISDDRPPGTLPLFPRQDLTAAVTWIRSMLRV